MSEDDELDLVSIIDRDRDKRIAFLREVTKSEDLQFVLTSSEPATEIDASFGTHDFENYQLLPVEVNIPNYTKIKKSFRNIENTDDPRLKILLGLTGLHNAPSADPRQQPAPKKLEISTILQESYHYAALDPDQQMTVNDILAELSKELELFHADQTPNKIFDLNFVAQRPNLQQILSGLNVFVNEQGEFVATRKLVPMPMSRNFPLTTHVYLDRPPLVELAPNSMFLNFDPQNIAYTISQQRFEQEIVKQEDMPEETIEQEIIKQEDATQEDMPIISDIEQQDMPIKEDESNDEKDW